MENLFDLAQEALERGDFDETEAILEQIEEKAEQIEEVIEANEEVREEPMVETREDEVTDIEVREDTKATETVVKVENIQNKDEEIVKDEETEEMKELSNQIETRDEVREFGKAVKARNLREFTTVEGAALIPEEVLGLVKTPSDVLDLRSIVATHKTKTGAGRIPVLSRSNAVLNTVAELAKNPELANPTLNQVPFEIETYRGYIPVSQEVIDDADYDVATMIAEHLDEVARNTANKEIAGILKTFTAKSVEGLDGLKTVLNVDVKAGYRKQIVLSQTAFNMVDTMKDTQGRYMLTQDITVASGYKLFGHEVIVVEDTVLGAEGEAKGFVGDLKRAVVFVDRKQATVKWADHDIYGQLLAVFLRMDAIKADADAGFFITLTAPVAAPQG